MFFLCYACTIIYVHVYIYVHVIVHTLLHTACTRMHVHVHVVFFYFHCSAVGVAYLFGFLVLVLAAVGFFFGSNAQKVCQSLEGPEYEGFANVSTSLGVHT